MHLPLSFLSVDLAYLADPHDNFTKRSYRRKKARAAIGSCRATFRATVEQYPKSRIRLRNRALVMEEHKPE